MTTWERRVAAILWNSAKDKKCGAKTREGGVCQLQPALPFSDRCHLHGGLSTGPRTKAGKARIAEAQRQRWAQWRAERGLSEVRRESYEDPTTLPVSGPQERICPDPEGIYVTEYEGGEFRVTAEIWEHGNRRNRIARMNRISKNLSLNGWCCRWCGEPMPIYRRADARFCRERCRKASARARKNAFR